MISWIQIRNFVETSHKLKLKTALAGSIKIDDLKKIPLLEADIVGIRGAACTNNDRLYGKITRKKVQEIVNSLKGI